MSVLPACANCGTALNGPYCSNCGQKASDTHRPFWWIAGEFLDAVFSYDSRTFRTIWLLFAEPGEFTRRYNAGQRASLLPPFRLFVIATLAFFLTLQATGVAMVAFNSRTVSETELPPEAVAALKKERSRVLSITNDGKLTIVTMDLFVSPEKIQQVTLSEADKQEFARASAEFDAEAKKASADEAGWVRWVEAKVKRAWEGFQRALVEPLKLNGPLNIWLPRLMLVLVPVFALLLAAMHWRPKVYLFEHLIFSIHIHTVVFVALALVALSAAIFGDAGYLWAIWLILGIYFWMALYRVYGRSWWLTSLKFVAIVVVYSIILTAGLVSIFLIALSEV